jgi:signal transduction histidine kinase
MEKDKFRKDYFIGTSVNFEEKLISNTISVEKVKHLLFENQQRYDLEIKALKANNKKLLAIIAHDIKTPMSSIIGYLSYLKEGIYEMDKTKIEENIDIVLHSARKSFSLLNELLEWAFAEKALGSYQPEHINLSNLIQAATESIAFLASQKQINIITTIIPNETIFIDINMIRTVLRNLLTNAIKYSHKNGKIILSTAKYNGFVEITIKDDGIGVNKEIHDKIFTDNSYNSRIGTNNEPGNGFGLLLCKEFIDIHGGKIWILSEPGKGSEFKFTLPLT